MDFSDITGFDWDDDNLYKNIEKHDLYDNEAKQVFFNHPLIVKREVPDFGSEQEEKDFWAEHDSTEYLEWDKGEIGRFPKLKPTTKSISIRLPESLIEDLKILANNRVSRISHC